MGVEGVCVCQGREQGVRVSPDPQELTGAETQVEVFICRDSGSRKECKRRSRNSFLSGVLIRFVDTNAGTAPDYFSKPRDSTIPSCLSLSP